MGKHIDIINRVDNSFTIGKKDFRFSVIDNNGKLHKLDYTTFLWWCGETTGIRKSSSKLVFDFYSCAGESAAAVVENWKKLIAGYMTGEGGYESIFSELGCQSPVSKVSFSVKKWNHNSVTIPALSD